MKENGLIRVKSDTNGGRDANFISFYECIITGHSISTSLTNNGLAQGMHLKGTKQTDEHKQRIGESNRITWANKRGK